MRAIPNPFHELRSTASDTVQFIQMIEVKRNVVVKNSIEVNGKKMGKTTNIKNGRSKLATYRYNIFDDDEIYR